ncbi:MAG: GNAT family N-acetyltransferase [Pseudomonadota bacterium]
MAASLEHPEGLEIDGVGPFDLGRLARLHRLCFDDAWSRSDLAQLLALPGGFGLIARSPGFHRLGIDTRRVLGFGLCRVVRDESELLSIGIAPDVRGRGLGSWLLRACMEHCHALGAERMFLEVAVDNAAARSLYDREGFVPVGRREGYYRRGDGERVAAVTMRLELQSS